ncbi:MAG: dockerin type I domain-containing protein [Patescibacteria group bacterium]
MMKKDALKLLTVFIVTVAGVFWALNYLFLSDKTAQKSKAANDSIEVSYDPATPTAAAGQDFTVMVRMKPPTNVSLRGYTLKLKFDKAILKAKYIDYKIGVPSPDFGDTSGSLTAINEAGTINIQGEIQNPTGLLINANTTNDIVRIVFTATQASGNTVALSNVNFYKVKSDGTIEVDEIASPPELKVNGGAAAAQCENFTDGFSASSLNSSRWGINTNNSGTVRTDNDELTITTPESTNNMGKTTYIYSKNLVGGDFAVETVFKGLSSTPASASGYVSGLGFFAHDSGYDGFAIERHGNGQLKVLYDWNNSDWVSPVLVNTSLGQNSPVKVKMERTGTEVKFYYDIFDGGGYRLAKSFTGAYAGKANIEVFVNNYGTSYPKAVGKFDDFKLACSGGGSVTPTVPAVNITPTGAIAVTGNTVLNLKLKFQGITAKPADPRNFMNVKFTLSGEGITTPLVKSGSFVSDASGVWSGKVGFDLTSPAGKKYTLYVKGPRHVQKKICVNAPAENTPGTYSCSAQAITLALGENTLDLSKVLQLSGDIYGTDKGQDGIVNSIDISYVKNNLKKADAAVLGICDINLDGKCDTQDYSLIISSLSIKSDEL